MSRPVCVASLAALALLAGCGTTTQDRALGGAGIGAAAGTVIGAVTGFGLVQGALLGAGVGAATGAVTTPSQVDLGQPVWKGAAAQPAGAQPAAFRAADPATVRAVQSGLVRLGYDPGAGDGVAGPRTRAAISRYQQDNRLPVDGNPSPELLAHIEQRR
jgi:peptidoglycan hydrolase-like protein with peptidoglycan-binding domain